MQTAAPSPKRRVLVTGLGGFTGRYAQQELEAHGWEVWGVGSQSLAGHPHYRCADLADIDSLRKVVAEVQPHAVLHLAAIAFVGHGTANDFYRVNLMGTRNLLEAVAQAAPQVACVLLASSANVYGNSAGGTLGESTPPAPANDYAVSKLAMEHMARLWLPRLPLVVTRPFNYTGVGQSTDFLLPKIVHHFKTRAPRMELGNLDVWRDFSDVRAVVQAYRLLLDAASAGAAPQSPVGQTVNVCSGVAHSLREVLALAQELTGHSLDVQVNPAFVRANEVKTLCGDATLLRSLIGPWEGPPLRETLRWMLQDGV